MLESNPPRNSRPETRPFDEEGVAASDRALIEWIDFPMPEKTP